MLFRSESADTPAVSAESEADQAEGAGEAEAVQEMAGEEKTGSGDVVELEWLHIWPEYDDIWKEAVADFEAQHENIKINTIAISWDKLSNSLLTYFAGGRRAGCDAYLEHRALSGHGSDYGFDSLSGS